MMRIFIYMAIFILVTGCSQKEIETKPDIAVEANTTKQGTVVLLLSDDKKASAIEVRSVSEKRLISDAKHYVTFEDDNTSLSAPEEMSDPQIDAMFGRALQALPPKPQEPEAVMVTLYFDRNSVALNDSALLALEVAYKTIMQRPSCTLQLTGFTDRKGSDAHNLKLSKERVGAVLFWLESHDVSCESVAKNYMGEKQLVVETEDGVLEPKNRRVEILIK